ncbi:MAG TPA: hypothetical protein VK889_10960 [Solirubrobacterales bacterium]|nr:hypothetical protein [Solirubrobacterales bacterium]
MRCPMARRLTTLVAATTASVALALPAAASGAESSYPPDAAARDFSGGAGGWESSSSFSGVCVAPVLCPTIANTHQPNGGADGGGFIRSSYSGVIGVQSVGGTATAIWESPQFVYTGAGGEDARSVQLTLSRRADVAELLAVAGNSATFSVQLENVNPGAKLTLIDETSLVGATNWTAIGAASVKASRLTAGDTYRIRIVTEYRTGTSVLVIGSADYDNVVLGASTVGANGKGGSDDGKGGGGGLSSGELSSLMRASGIGDFATLIGARGARGANGGDGNGGNGGASATAKRLLVKLRCPAKVGRTCKIRAQGLLNKRKPATFAKRVSIRRGKARKVALRLKPKAKARVAKRKFIRVKAKVRAGKTKATVVKRLRLIRR